MQGLITSVKLESVFNVNKYKSFRLAFVAILLYQSLAKGWATLGLVPLLVIVIPVMFILSRLTTDAIMSSKSNNGLLRFLAWGIISLPVIAYTTVVGFGDSDDVFLFGFLSSNNDSLIAQVSQSISFAAIALYIPFHLFTLVYVLRSVSDES